MAVGDHFPARPRRRGCPGPGRTVGSGRLRYHSAGLLCGRDRPDGCVGPRAARRPRRSVRDPAMGGIVRRVRRDGHGAHRPGLERCGGRVLLHRLPLRRKGAGWPDSAELDGHGRHQWQDLRLHRLGDRARRRRTAVGIRRRYRPKPAPRRGPNRPRQPDRPGLVAGCPDRRPCVVPGLRRGQLQRLSVRHPDSKRCHGHLLHGPHQRLLRQHDLRRYRSGCDGYGDPALSDHHGAGRGATPRRRRAGCRPLPPCRRPLPPRPNGTPAVPAFT